MKVLMFGWEFPPQNSGGLGTACYGLTKSLAKKGLEITFVMPTNCKTYGSHLSKVIAADTYPTAKIKITCVDSILRPYQNEEQYIEAVIDVMKRGSLKKLYGKNLQTEVLRYSLIAEKVAKDEPHDIIHAHDWMTFRAGIAAKNVSKKPLVIHVHATEFDRTGGHPNQVVYDIEREGMHAADIIIAVSQRTKDKIIEHYGIPDDKVVVVHNGVVQENYDPDIDENDKVVLFLGRLTLQKGPDYFLAAAKRILDIDKDVKFVIAGSGDMERRIIEQAAELGISKNVLFTGFLRGDDVARAYKLARVYVMPSISEPFGITPLESLKQGTPVVISRQSGVSEVLSHCLKTNFWDIDDLSDKILGVLKYNTLHQELVENGVEQVKSITWEYAAEKCVGVYNGLM